ncbi:MAG: hypothetical protein QM765_21095 [Myxococcales bacterium]
MQPQVLVVVVVALVLACSHAPKVDEADGSYRERYRASQANCEDKPKISREERFPLVQQKMHQIMGMPESEATSKLFDCEMLKPRGRVVKYQCHLALYEGCRHPNANILLICSDGVVTDWKTNE